MRKCLPFMEIDNLQMGIGVIQSFRSVMNFPWILDIDVCLYLYMIRFVELWLELKINSKFNTRHLSPSKKFSQQNRVHVILPFYSESHLLMSGDKAMVNTDNNCIESEYIQELLGTTIVRSSRPEVFCKKSCSQKFRRIHRKTPVRETLS